MEEPGLNPVPCYHCANHAAIGKNVLNIFEKYKVSELISTLDVSLDDRYQQKMTVCKLSYPSIWKSKATVSYIKLHGSEVKAKNGAIGIELGTPSTEGHTLTNQATPPHPVSVNCCFKLTTLIKTWKEKLTLVKFKCFQLQQKLTTSTFYRKKHTYIYLVQQQQQQQQQQYIYLHFSLHLLK